MYHRCLLLDELFGKHHLPNHQVLSCNEAVENRIHHRDILCPTRGIPIAIMGCPRHRGRAEGEERRSIVGDGHRATRIAPGGTVKSHDLTTLGGTLYRHIPRNRQQRRNRILDGDIDHIGVTFSTRVFHRQRDRGRPKGESGFGRGTCWIVEGDVWGRPGEGEVIAVGVGGCNAVEGGFCAVRGGAFYSGFTSLVGASVGYGGAFIRNRPVGSGENMGTCQKREMWLF